MIAQPLSSSARVSFEQPISGRGFHVRCTLTSRHMQLTIQYFACSTSHPAIEASHAKHAAAMRIGRCFAGLILSRHADCRRWFRSDETGWNHDHETGTHSAILD